MKPEIATEAQRLFEHGRRIAGSILDGSVDPVHGARQLHEEVVGPLGHPAGLIAWCGLADGIHVSRHDFSTGRVDGAEWSAAIAACAARFIDGDPTSLATVSEQYAAHVRRTRSRIREWLAWLGLALQLASFALLSLLVIQVVRKGWGIVKFDFMMLLMFGPGTLFFFGQRLLRAVAQSALSAPTALLLRPFALDKNGFFIRGADPGIERRLERALRGACEVVAIGRPREILPPVGGRRVYIDVRTEDWKYVVALEIFRAPLVIMLAGESLGPGARWELEHVVSHVPAAKFILVGPFGAGFKQDAADILPHPLPPTPGRLSRLLGLDAFISFDSQWRPRIEPFSKLKEYVAPLLVA